MEGNQRNPMDLFRLDGRVALVTGGAGLLGREFSRALAGAGAIVILADIDAGQAEKAAGEMAGLDGEVHGRQLDVTDPTSAQNTVSAIVKDYSRLDVLINSAALDPKFDSSKERVGTHAFEDYPLEPWQEALTVNLTGTFLMCQAAGREMLPHGSGVMINICSTYGLVGPDQRIYQREGQAVQYKPAYYSASKAGVLGFTRYLAAYYAGKGIRVNALSPGGVFNDHDDAFVEAYSTRTILGRMARRDELSGAVLFLASDASSYMTGANLIVDGGWTAW